MGGGDESDSGSWYSDSGSEDEEDDDFERAGPCCCWGASVGAGPMVVATFVLLGACLVAHVGLQSVPLMMAETGWVPALAPAGSESVKGAKALEHAFPLLGASAKAQFVMLLRATPGQPTVLTQAVDDFSQEIASRLKTDTRVSFIKPIMTAYYTGNPKIGLPRESPILRAGFVSSDTRATLLAVLPTQQPPPEIHLADWQVRDNVLAFLHEFASNPPPGTEAMITGPPAISAESSHDDSIEAVAKAEMYTFPLAMLIFGLLIGDARLLIVPPITLALSYLTAAIFVLQYARTTPDFPQEVPVVMGSVVMAFSLDYTLFLLTRFQENRAIGLRMQENIFVVLKHTAHTIGISGTLVAFAFMAAVVIPDRSLKASGIALSLTTVACMLVNATVVPAFLLFAGRFLTLPLCGSRRRAKSLLSARDLPGQSSPMQKSHTHRSELGALAKAGSEGFWLWLMRRVEKRPRTSVLLVLLAFLPLLLQLSRLHATADSYAMLPDTMPSIRALHIMDECGFTVGRFDPYEVVITTTNPIPGLMEKNKFRLPFKRRSAMLTEQSFAAMLELADSINATGGVAAMLGPVWLINKRIDFEEAARMRIRNVVARHTLYSYLLTETMETHVHQQSALLQVHSDFLPLGSGAAAWVIKVREHIRAWNLRHPEYHATLTGGASDATDVRDSIMGAMVTYVGITVAGVTLVVLLMFRSVLLTVRLTFALLFTLGATFAIAVVIYQTPLLHPLYPWLAKYSGLAFDCLPVTTCIAIALGLDYDIFLVTRVIEFREDGFNDRNSIVQGVATTGSIISGAGMIMSLAFSGLMFSSKLLLNQMGLLLVTSVLLDTFVVRTLLVPALMLSADGWNWWPRKMPEPVHGESRASLVDSSSESSYD